MADETDRVVRGNAAAVEGEEEEAMVMLGGVDGVTILFVVVAVVEAGAALDPDWGICRA